MDRLFKTRRLILKYLFTKLGCGKCDWVKNQVDLDGISDADIAGLNIPTGIPLLYELNDDFTPVTKGGEYLDPAAAADAPYSTG